MNEHQQIQVDNPLGGPRANRQEVAGPESLACRWTNSLQMPGPRSGAGSMPLRLRILPTVDRDNECIPSRRSSPRMRIEPQPVSRASLRTSCWMSTLVRGRPAPLGAWPPLLGRPAATAERPWRDDRNQVLDRRSDRPAIAQQPPTLPGRDHDPSGEPSPQDAVLLAEVLHRPSQLPIGRRGQEDEQGMEELRHVPIKPENQPIPASDKVLDHR